MQSLSTEISGRTFDLARRGYAAEQVDAFLAYVAEQVEEMEDDLRASAVRLAALQRRVEIPKEATQRIEAAYLAASDAKHKLLEDAQAKADAIVARAERDAAELTRNPSALADEARSKAEDILLQAKRRLEEAEAEALRTETLAAAKAEQAMADARAAAEAVVTDARREALAAVAAAEQDARTRLARTEARYREIADKLSTLQAAVADMLAEGMATSEDIRLVLDESPSTGSVAVPVTRIGHDTEVTRSALPGG